MAKSQDEGFQVAPRAPRNTTRTHKVLSQNLRRAGPIWRRELSDSKAAVAEREGNPPQLWPCVRDSQRAWLLLEDYFEKLWLTRKDFSPTDNRLVGRSCWEARNKEAA